MDAVADRPETLNDILTEMREREVARGFKSKKLSEWATRIEAAVANSQGEGLWCLHILGPDDVHAAPSRAHAMKAAERFNAHFGPIAEKADVLCTAVASPWPHSAQSHAESVDVFIAQWLTPAPQAMREVVEAATRVNGEHSAPHDCYATGPLTGNYIADLVACPGCALANALASPDIRKLLRDRHE